jgi:hypothetical protein
MNTMLRNDIAIAIIAVGSILNILSGGSYKDLDVSS